MLFIAIFLFLLFLAGGFAASADKLQDRIQFYSSIFRNLNPHFFLRTLSARKKFIIGTRVRFDGWHTAKSGMWGCIVLSYFFYRPITPWFLVDVVIMLTVICQSINLFIHVILHREFKEPLIDPEL